MAFFSLALFFALTWLVFSFKAHFFFRFSFGFFIVEALCLIGLSFHADQCSSSFKSLEAEVQSFKYDKDK